MVPNRDKTNLIDQHLALLLMVFLDAGLVEVSLLPRCYLGDAC